MNVSSVLFDILVVLIAAKLADMDRAGVALRQDPAVILRDE